MNCTSFIIANCALRALIKYNCASYIIIMYVEMYMGVVNHVTYLTPRVYTYIPDLSDLPCLQVARAQHTCLKKHGEWMKHEPRLHVAFNPDWNPG